LRHIKKEECEIASQHNAFIGLTAIRFDRGRPAAGAPLRIQFGNIRIALGGSAKTARGPGKNQT
jgi:hypothetical protein